jgi:hypothetical protein
MSANPIARLKSTVTRRLACPDQLVISTPTAETSTPSAVPRIRQGQGRALACFPQVTALNDGVRATVQLVFCSPYKLAVGPTGFTFIVCGLKRKGGEYVDEAVPCPSQLPH